MHFMFEDKLLLIALLVMGIEIIVDTVFVNIPRINLHNL